jgi:signal transduction histidine kinase
MDLESEIQVEKKNGLTKQLMLLVAHDLKSPVNNIIGFLNLLEILLHEKQEQEIKDYFNIIRKEAEHALNLINSLSDYCKTMQIDFPIDEKNVIEDILEHSRKEHDRLIVGI